MNAHAETTHNDERHYETDYTLFVMVDGNPTQPPLATTQGHNENGYHGTGSTLTVHPGRRQQHHHQVTPRVARSHQTNTNKKQEKEKHKP